MSGRKATQEWRLDRLARWSAVATRRRLVLAPALLWPAVRIRLSPVCPALPLRLAVGRLPYPTAADEVVVRYDVGGGLPPPPGTAARRRLDVQRFLHVPPFTLYGDGRVFQGSPGLGVTVSRLSETGVQVLLDAARDACLIGQDQYLLKVDDLGFERISVSVSDQTFFTTLNPPSFSYYDPPAAVAARDFIDRLRDLTWLPSGTVLEAPAPAPKDRLRAVAAPLEEGQTPPAETPPATETPVGSGLEVDGVWCWTVEGDEAVRLAEALESSGGYLAVLQDGRPYLLYARPLLPDESGC
jgi:hypothetical protein